MRPSTAPRVAKAPALDRAALRDAPRRSLSSGRNRGKADVFVVEHGGREVVVKDFASRSWLVRQTVGRWSVRREVRNYRLLAGVRGIPRLEGRPDAYCLAIEKIDGAPLRRRREGGADPEIFRALRGTLEDIHRRGVAIADLHHGNVLLGADGPYVVDLTMAVRSRPGFHPLGLVLFRLFRPLDRVALLRMKRRFVGALDAEEERALTRDVWVHRLGRRLKAALDAVRGRRRGTHA